MTPVPGEIPTMQSPQARSDDRARFLFDLDGIDLSKKLIDAEGLRKWNPHRGDMALLDGLVWQADDHSRGIGVKHVREDEFWVPGHFPSQPMFPGVLQVETGAQLACYLFNVRQPAPVIAAFLRIEEAAFRAMVKPGDDLYVLCQDTKRGRRRFICDIQGIVDNKLAFEARITGMALEPDAYNNA